MLYRDFASLRDLIGQGQALGVGEKVEFVIGGQILNYENRSTAYLSNLTGPNSAVFDLLGITGGKGRAEEAEKWWGYRVDEGYEWPEAQNEKDMTLLAAVVMGKCEGLSDGKIRAQIDAAKQGKSGKKRKRGRDDVHEGVNWKELRRVVLAEDVLADLGAVLEQHRYMKKLFEDWGLGEVLEYGRTTSLLFWGAPGTGKTWAARCIARALGKELIELGGAQLQSSEPGAVERNITAYFEQAKREGKVILLDECDGMVQTRVGMGQIMSSENNALMQAIEKHDGVVILTTNRIDALDEALERRLALIVEFPKPDAAARGDIWAKLIPKKMPLGSDVVIAELAAYQLTGGQIKNVLLNAARFAVVEPKRKKMVCMRHFQRAMERVQGGKAAFEREGEREARTGVMRYGASEMKRRMSESEKEKSETGAVVKEMAEVAAA